MKLEKSYKIVIVCICVYVAIMLVIFLPRYLHNRNDNLYILSGDFIKIKYQNGTWKNITKEEDYRLQKFTVYEDSNYKGEYKLLFTNRFYLYDDLGKDISYDGRLFAYRGSLKLGTVKLEESMSPTEADSIFIQEALSQLKIVYQGDFNLFQKASLDVDNDGVVEHIYCISNYYSEEVSDKVFSIIFIEKNNSIHIIQDKVISSDKIYEEPSYEINQIIDIKEDKKYEIMLEQSYYSRPEESCILLYRLDENQRKIADLCK